MSHRTPLLAALVALLAATGCAVDQAAEVAIYRSVLDADVSPSRIEFSPDQPLNLEAALGLANQHNERLAIGGEDYVQAVIDKKRVIADFLPTIDLVPALFVREKSGFDKSLATDRHFDAPVQGAFGPFNALRSLENLKSVTLTIEQRRELLLDLRASLLLDVATAFYQVLRLERQVQVLINSLAVQEERVRDVEAQKEAGTARPLDVAQARAQAASTRAILTLARGQVQNSRHVLAFLVGVAAVEGPVVDDFNLPVDAGDRNSLEARAVEHRRDVLAARAAVQATRHSVDAAFAQYYPTITVNLDYFVYKESVPDQSMSAALVQANVPIFRAGLIEADVRTAWSLFRQAKERESLVLRQVRQDVRIAFQDLQTSESRIKDLQTNVAAAQEAVDQSTDLVRAGRATNLERLVAQDQLLTAQLALTGEQFNRKVAYLQLRRATDDLTLRMQRDGAAVNSK